MRRFEIDALVMGLTITQDLCDATIVVRQNGEVCHPDIIKQQEPA